MPPIVVVNDLHYAYPPLAPGHEPEAVLRGVSLSLHRAECLALLGPTGAGKSTLCLALNGIIPHLMGGTFTGKVQVEGTDTRDLKPGTLSQTVGMVFQEPESQLFTMTVADEIAFGLESLALPQTEIEPRLAESLMMMDIADLRDRSPLELSGGQQQRVALAAALAMRPQVLVLDEPTASLDPRGKRSVLQAVAQLRREMGMTILWVTQDVDRVPLLADRVAVLAGGRIQLEGTPAHVFSQGCVLQRLQVGLPQMSELASRFNTRWGTDHVWLTVEDAAAALKELPGD